jgi:glycosyltransferase involved in cell wall biosynthesis
MPVYNAEHYIERAVESVVHLDEAGELILVDDGSVDNSLAVCQILEKKYNKLKLFTHADKKNHGAAASRNIGIKKSTFVFIAFLDADDYYLPNRFESDKEIFKAHPNVDGVYGCTLARFKSETAREKFLKGNIAERTTFSKEIPPGQLFSALMFGGYGCFHTSGITLKKTIFEKSGIFNEKIRYVEDTELWYKLSLTGKIVAGNIQEPIAIRWVHEDNSIHEFEKIQPYRKLMYKEVFQWAMKKPFPFAVKNAFFMALQSNTYQNKKLPLHILLGEAIEMPSVIFSMFFIKKIHLILIKSSKR